MDPGEQIIQRTALRQQTAANTASKRVAGYLFYVTNRIVVVETGLQLLGEACAQELR